MVVGAWAGFDMKTQRVERGKKSLRVADAG
jgi:hypothetical protein